MWLLEIRTQWCGYATKIGFRNKPIELWRQKQGPISKAEEEKQLSELARAFFHTAWAMFPETGTKWIENMLEIVRT